MFRDLRLLRGSQKRPGATAFWTDWAEVFEALILPPLLYALILGLVWLLMAQSAHAGGPAFVAGNTYFDPSMKGMPIVWAQGAVVYYTDQGDLSPLLPGPTADSFVADAFTRWTSVPTAAITANRGGQLAEDVNGSNVIVNSDNSITMPADIQPSATSKPVGVVYDFDGKVTDALLGSGAGDPLYCFTNAVFGGPDNFSTAGYIAHALVILNGNCAQTTAQLPDVKYRLVRVLGKVLGLDWSQLNVNVITRTPIPTSDDFGGFPLMHSADMVGCVPVSLCYPNADQPRMDDRAAISRLYPITAQNLANFPGKQLFYENTVRIHGSVAFVDAQGQPSQGMQGVNVVARWIDPATGVPSHTYSASFVSGALFRGNAGNPVNGPNDSSGLPYARFGSDDSAVEGFFDLGGLEIPNGSNSAQYQLSAEPIDTNWSEGVGPYAPWQVTPSGAAQPVVVTVSKGSDVQQNLLMQGNATLNSDAVHAGSYDSPAVLPASGDWIASLGRYGETDFFQFSGQAYRTMSVEVTALDDSGSASENKARPVLGVWALADPDGTLAPAATPSPFNSAVFGMTRLDASLLAATNFRIGISDDRGDGRPDFHYHAHILYADTVAPTRVSMRGGTPLIIQGIGFSAGLTASIAGTRVPILAVSGDQIILSAPALAKDGVQSIALTEPSTGASSVMADTLTFGAAATDSIKLISGGGNPAVPVGGETPIPIVVVVTAADGVTPISGASVAWSATSGALSACGVAPACTVATDDSGQASTRLTATSVGAITVTATLAPAAYSNAKQVVATVVATSSATDITLTSQYRWLAYGATIDVPLMSRVMSNGSALSGAVVNYQVVKGTGSLTATNVATDPNGYAAVTLHLSNLASEVDVSACVGPSLAPCNKFTVYAVPVSALQLATVSGSGQIVSVGQPFQPIMLRVTDSAGPPHPVQGASVNFQTTIMRPDQDAPTESNGESSSGNHAMPVILGLSQLQVISNVNGIASIVPSAGSHSGAVELEIVASAGTSAAQQLELESLWPVPVSGQGASSSSEVGASLRNNRNGVQDTAPQLNSYFVGETWGVSAESGNLSSSAASSSAASADAETMPLMVAPLKAGDEGQAVSDCEQRERTTDDCAEKVPQSPSAE